MSWINIITRLELHYADPLSMYHNFYWQLISKFRQSRRRWRWFSVKEKQIQSHAEIIIVGLKPKLHLHQKHDSNYLCVRASWTTFLTD